MIDYKKSGVDIQAGDDLVDWLQQGNAETNAQISPFQTKSVKSEIGDLNKRVLSGIGGFASLFDGRFPTMSEPMLVSCTDGVGTKVKMAAHFSDYSTVGQDLVAMCANDLICTGGVPLFFLDYYATGKLDLPAAKQFLNGVKRACAESHMVLIGGETAEMPGVYQPKDFDCAGFSVGVVDKPKLLGSHKVRVGDVVIGLSSSGFHSNGFSLIRKVFENDYDNHKSWLLEPTRLYVKAAFELRELSELRALSHITGGGIENLPRVLPQDVKAKLKHWNFPACFQEVQKRAGISRDEMLITFNCGIGMMAIIGKSQESEAINLLRLAGYESQILGEIEERTGNEAQVVWN